MRRLFAPVDIAALVAFRIIFGGLMLIAMMRYFLHGWIADFFLVPRVFFTYTGFEWVVPWPGVGMYVHYAVLALAALGILFGAWYRLSIAVFFVAFTYAHLIDKSLYLNHYYLVMLLSFLMTLMPLGWAGSVDTWRRPERTLTAVPAWMVWVLRFQLGVVYIFSGIAKINADWLLQAQPLRIWLAARTDTPVLGPWFEHAWVAYAMSWSGMLFDLTIVPFLLWRRTRPAAYLVVIAFHVLTSMLFPIGMFPWIMVGLTTIFFAPDWPRRLPLLGVGVRQLASRFASRWGIAVASVSPLMALRRRERVGSCERPSWAPRTGVAVFLAAYVIIQLAVPLRAFMYPGPVCWSEEGFRFAWRVMLMQKDGHAEFTVTDTKRGQSWRIDPNTYLTPLQAGMMATQPDMIRSFGRWLAAEWRKRGYEDVAVRAEVYASLNGRTHELLIDPTIDLAATPDSAPRGTVAPLASNGS